jgi:hypothetical protein
MGRLEAQGILLPAACARVHRGYACNASEHGGGSRCGYGLVTAPRLQRFRINIVRYVTFLNAKRGACANICTQNRAQCIFHIKEAVSSAVNPTRRKVVHMRQMPREC